MKIYKLKATGYEVSEIQKQIPYLLKFTLNQEEYDEIPKHLQGYWDFEKQDSTVHGRNCNITTARKVDPAYMLAKCNCLTKEDTDFTGKPKIDKDYIPNDDGTAECRECKCTSTAEQYENGDCQHWNNCSKLSEEADYHE